MTRGEQERWEAERQLEECKNTQGEARLKYVCDAPAKAGDRLGVTKEAWKMQNIKNAQSS